MKLYDTLTRLVEEFVPRDAGDAGVLGYDLGVASTPTASVAPLVEELLTLRQEARARRDFATADRIRDRVTQAGIVVEDAPDGPRWHVL